MPSVSVRSFARLLEINPARVSDWIAEGLPAGPPTRGRAGRQINVRLAHDWLVRRALAKVATPDGLETQDQADLRQTRANADIAQVRALEAQNRVIDLDEAVAVIDRMAVLCATQIDALSGRMAARVAAETDPAVCRQLLFDEGRQIRAALAAEFQGLAAREKTGEPSGEILITKEAQK